ncbi:MAG: class I SAM-dependent methyltransferase [Elainellaceae cyanobacterium]
MKTSIRASFRRGAIALLLLLVAIAAVMLQPSPAYAVTASQSAPDHGYTYRQPSSDGIGKIYMGREISQVMGHRGAGWLERSSRRQEERPWKIIDALDLNPNDTVVDLGAGTGYLTFQLAPEVPQGKVLAVDIQPEMLDMLTTLQRRRGVENVEPILAEVDDPHLPFGVDCVLMVDAYHEFEFPREVMEAVMASLNPGGRVVLAEYRGENPFLSIKRLHKMTERQVKKELESVGLEWIKTEEQLPRQHLLFFQKP